MNDADQALIAIAQDALQSGKTVMVAIRHSNATPILAIQSSATGALLTLACPASEDFGVGASQLTIRASDLLGVSVFD